MVLDAESPTHRHKHFPQQEHYGENFEGTANNFTSSLEKALPKLPEFQELHPNAHISNNANKTHLNSTPKKNSFPFNKNQLQESPKHHHIRARSPSIDAGRHYNYRLGCRNMQDILDHPFLKHNYLEPNELNVLEKKVMDSIFESGKKKRRSYYIPGMDSSEFELPGEGDISQLSNELKFGCGIRKSNASNRGNLGEFGTFRERVKLQILDFYLPPSDKIIHKKNGSSKNDFMAVLEELWGGEMNEDFPFLKNSRVLTKKVTLSKNGTFQILEIDQQSSDSSSSSSSNGSEGKNNQISIPEESEDFDSGVDSESTEEETPKI